MEENNQQKNIKDSAPVIHTYSSDMADAIRTDEITAIKVALAEQQKHEREDFYNSAKATPTQKILWILGSIILIGGGIIGAYFLYQKKAADLAAIPAPINIDTVISYDDHVFIDTTNTTTSNDVVNLLRPEIQKTQQSGTIHSIFLTKKNGTHQALLSPSDFLSALGTNAPIGLTDLFTDTYMLGTYQAQDTNNIRHVFLLLPVTNYSQAYAYMLKWEKTLLNDFFPLFHIDVSNDQKKLLQKPFDDIVINNKDTRVLYNNTGKPILYYLFVDNSTLLITDNDAAIKEIIARFITKNAKTQ